MAGANEFSVVAWTKSLRNLAKVSAITIVNHLKGCGKKEIGEKGYKFFTENYIHDVFVKEEDSRSRTCYVKGRCFRSQKKSKVPHTVKLKIAADREDKGNVEEAECSCKAG